MATDTSNLQAYWQELAKRAGLPEDKAKLVSDALADETVQKTREMAMACTVLAMFVVVQLLIVVVILRRQDAF